MLPSPTRKVGQKAVTLSFLPRTVGVTASNGAVETLGQLDGDLSNDPIAQTMVIRIKLGGHCNNATEVDAKK